MQTAMQLISERERLAPPLSNRVRLYTFVRPRANGEATVEVWGAMNNKNRKGAPIMGKCFYKFRTESKTYRIRDVLWYSSWSVAAHDHLCYSMHDCGGTDYYRESARRCGGGEMSGKGKWLTNRICKDQMHFLPTGATMLNGWEGTKYRYCAYDANCGMSVMEYLALWKKYPQAEILSKMGCFTLIDEDFLARVSSDRDFAKYVAKNQHGIREHSFTYKELNRLYRKRINANDYARHIREEQERREAAALKREMAKYRQYDIAIGKLYERIKAICGQYGAYEVIVPKNSEDMLAEGKAMHNCIGKCYAASQGKANICLFLHRDGKPCVDVRIDAKTYKVVECRAVCNKEAEKDAWALAWNLATEIREYRRAA